MKPFPSKSHMRWRRLDVPGREEARIEQTAEGWRLTGRLEAEEACVRAELMYVIECERDWRTRRTVVTGSASGAPVRFELVADGEGQWTLNGAPLPLVEGALDIDLGFTPATNLLPIRRLDLAVGERAEVRTAWVRFPELRVEALEQSYQREAARVFRYEAMVDGERFQARLDTDDFGRVLLYEGLWEAETDERSREEREPLGTRRRAPATTRQGEPPPMATPVAVYLEEGAKRTFAAALDWPGWCRQAPNGTDALAALLAYGPKYASILAGTRLGFVAPKDLAPVDGAVLRPAGGMARNGAHVGDRAAHCGRRVTHACSHPYSPLEGRGTISPGARQ